MTFMSARRHGPAAPVEVLPRPQLELVEVGLVEVAAHLEHHHLKARLRELARDHAAARARADDHHVALEALPALWRQRHDRLVHRRRRRDRPGVAEGLPEGVPAARRVGQRVAEEHRAGDQACQPERRFLARQARCSSAPARARPATSPSKPCAAIASSSWPVPCSLLGGSCSTISSSAASAPTSLALRPRRSRPRRARARSTAQPCRRAPPASFAAAPSGS